MTSPPGSPPPLALLLAPLSTAALSRLRQVPGWLVRDSSQAPPSPDNLKQCTALFIRSGQPVTASLLDKAPHLQAIFTATSGYDHIDLLACGQRGIAVFHAPDANTRGAAELTIFFLLGLIRQIPFSQRGLTKGTWRTAVPRGEELSGRTLGLIGLGRVGSMVARLAKPLGLDLLAYDPYVDHEIFDSLQVKPAGLIELLRQAHFVSLHVPLTQETRHLINATTLEYISLESYLINTSRGAVVNEQHLVEFLETKRLAGAALDVFEREPLAPHSQLHQLSQEGNVLLTPHIGAHTVESFERSSQAVVNRFIEFMNGDRSHGDLAKNP